MQSLEFVNANRIPELTKDLVQNGYYVGYVNGSDVSKIQDFIDKIWDAFAMPQEERHCVDALLDWITDLSWLHESKYALIIENYTEIIDKDRRYMHDLIGTIVNHVLLWWHKDVLTCVVGGEVKTFRIFLCA